MKLKNNILTFFLILILISLSLMYVISGKIEKKESENDQTKETITNIVENKNKELNLTIVGDLLFESPYEKAIENGESKELYFNRVKKYFENDDISIGNMEVVIGNDKMKTSGDGYNFCAPSWVGSLVASLDFQILSTANNHSYDRGLDGINSTIDFFKNNTKIETIGTEKNSSSQKIRILEKNGIKVGFASFTLGTNIKPTKENVDLINYYKDPYTKEILKDKIKEQVDYLKKNSDVVIVLMHWGTEFTFVPNNEQKELAKYLSDLGVNIVVGSHSHSIQPIEMIGNTLVYYSLGNFVSADDDIARTPKGQETFDNAYQFGLLSKIKLELDNDNNITFKDVKAEPIINYFDSSMKNFELVPFSDYTTKYEQNHYRYSLGLTHDFINKTFNDVIDEKYR